MKRNVSALSMTLAASLIAASVIIGGILITEMRPLPAAIELPVPYISQAPDGEWISPWDEACEEASIAMVQGYYSLESVVSVRDSRAYMQEMIDWEAKVLKKYNDTDANETLRLISAKTNMAGYIKRDPTTTDIKRELSRHRPVIALLDMYELYGEPDLGDSYHVLVITGYDENKKEFIVLDPARSKARYPYDTLLKSLHDFNAESREADGQPTVIFTAR